MRSLAILRDEHSEILRIVRRLTEVLVQPSPPPPLHLLALRYELSASLIAHHETEDCLVYPRLLASADTRMASTARAFSEDMGGLLAAYVAHCRKWQVKAITADWDGYRSDGRVLIGELTRRMAREDREISPLLEALARAA
jgi:hypothetical protein